jgi:hypothetical protein
MRCTTCWCGLSVRIELVIHVKFQWHDISLPIFSAVYWTAMLTRCIKGLGPGSLMQFLASIPVPRARGLTGILNVAHYSTCIATLLKNIQVCWSLVLTVLMSLYVPGNCSPQFMAQWTWPTLGIILQNF